MEASNPRYTLRYTARPRRRVRELPYPMRKTLSVWTCSFLLSALFLSGLSQAQVQNQFASSATGWYDSYRPLGIQESTLHKLNRAVSLDFDDVMLEQALASIAQQAGLQLIYADWDVLRQHRVTLDLKGKTVLKPLYEAVAGTGFHCLGPLVEASALARDLQSVGL